MTLPLPDLDDRSWREIVDHALLLADRAGVEWDERNAADPGITLLELFAYLTKNMHYRLNRLPKRLQVALLNLVGVRRRSTAAAIATLHFAWAGEGEPPAPDAIGEIATADGTRFHPAEPVRFQDGTAVARALHGVWIDETLGTTNGSAVQAFRLSAPVIAESGFPPDILVAIAGDPDTREAAARVENGVPYLPCREVPFLTGQEDVRCCTVDRAEGVVTVRLGRGMNAPSLGRAVYAWYRTGGGRAGNIGAGQLVLVRGRDGGAIAGLTVIQPLAAAGGADAETIDQASERAPLAASSDTAITARDFERAALAVGGVLRARASAPAQDWAHAEPGIVRVEIAAEFDIDEAVAPIGVAAVKASRTHALAGRVNAALDVQRPLGVRTSVGWLQVREVSVSLRAFVGRGDDFGDVERRLVARLNRLFSPRADRPLGRILRAFDIYEAVLAEPSVRYADRLTFTITEAPAAGAVDILADPHQPHSWLAASSAGCFRSTDDGESWALVHAIEDARPLFVRRSIDRAGLLAFGISRGTGSAILWSADTGETWAESAAFDFELFDGAWIVRDGAPILMAATGRGLYQVAIGRDPVPVPVGGGTDASGFYAVATARSSAGVATLFVAARNGSGIFRSLDGGGPGGFTPFGLDQADVRELHVQRAGNRQFLWAAAGAEAGEPGRGAFRQELRATGEIDPAGWVAMTNGWQGGSCEGLAFAGRTVFAASNRAGVLSLDLGDPSPAWVASAIDSGLPQRDTRRLFEPVASVAARSEGDVAILFAAGPAGVYRQLAGRPFTCVSPTVFTDLAPLPNGWLYCSGTHEVMLVAEQAEGERA